MSCGIDAVSVSRFLRIVKNPRWLNRIFFDQEIQYITSIPALTLQRCAGRFAAKEAVFKAVSSRNTAPFLHFCKLCEIKRGKNGPYIVFHDDLSYLNSLPISLSITHTDELAFACAIITHSN